jgi:hypothetical protein
MPLDPEYYPHPDSIDSFAQTAGTDDLFFDDDFTPVADSVIESAPVEDSHEPGPEPEQIQNVAPATGGLGQSRHSHAQHIPTGPANTNGDRGRGRGRGNNERGRGRGGRGRGRGGIQNMDAPSEPRASRNTDIRIEEAAAKAKESETAILTTTTDTPEASTPTGPSSIDPKPTPSVRGDRRLTGGPSRTRLTPSELTAKLASMSAKNSALAEAHARAEADAAQFASREAEASKKTEEEKRILKQRQKMDRQNRQQMMGERERNRLRKLEAQGGREWDLEKEDGFSGTGEERRRGAARGLHGGIAPDRAPKRADEWGAGESEDPVSQSAQRGRGRGRGRGGRGPRGGRGDHNTTSHTDAKSQPQHPPTASDFPDLPSAQPKSLSTSTPTDTEAPKKLDFPIKGAATSLKTSELEERPTVKKQESFGLPSPVTGSWADQVEGS